MEKLAAIAGKLANHRRGVESPVIQVDEINAPLTGCGVVEAERLRFNAKLLVGARDIELFEICVAVEEFLVVRNPLVLDPNVGVVEAVRQTADVSFPVADHEVKIVRTIMLRKTCGIRGGLTERWRREHCNENENEKK
jgi:hypothetical protein